MTEKMPRTPFSMPLSGSARLTEMRLKNIFSGPKKRPPVLFLALMFSVCLLCGNLVSCNVAEPEDTGDPARLEDTHLGSVSLDEREPRPASQVPIDPDYPPQDEKQEQLIQALFQAAEREKDYQFQIPTARLLTSIQKDDWILGAVFVEDHLGNTLILGIMDEETGEVPHAIFQRSYHVGVPNIVTFQKEGADYLLYTFNGQENGQYTGEAGLIRFDGEYMAWEWPVEGDARYGKAPPDGHPGAYSEYQEYWYHHLALMAPGGVDIYEVDPEFQWGQDEPASMWQISSGETFYYDPSSASELPMPIYFQSLNWLIDHTNDPGGWRIASLTLNEELSDPEEMVDCYTLRAFDYSGMEAFNADLFFPYESEPSRPRIYDTPDHAEVHEKEVLYE